MPKEVVASAKADAENNRGFLDYLAEGGSSSPMSFNAGDPLFTRPSAVAAKSVVNSEQEIRNNFLVSQMAILNLENTRFVLHKSRNFWPFLAVLCCGKKILLNQNHSLYFIYCA